LGSLETGGQARSSLLKIIEKQISEEDGEDILVVNFDAWLYQGYDDARAVLLEVIVKMKLKQLRDEILLKGHSISLIA
jgi:predicted KAP-like P-loop ATPase